MGHLKTDSDPVQDAGPGTLAQAAFCPPPPPQILNLDHSGKPLPEVIGPRTHHQASRNPCGHRAEPSRGHATTSEPVHLVISLQVAKAPGQVQVCPLCRAPERPPRSWGSCGARGTVFVSRARPAAPQPGRQPQRCTVSQFRRPEAQNQGVSRPVPLQALGEPFQGWGNPSRLPASGGCRPASGSVSSAALGPNLPPLPL